MICRYEVVPLTTVMIESTSIREGSGTVITSNRYISIFFFTELYQIYSTWTIIL